jgi:hypothetical protein
LIRTLETPPARVKPGSIPHDFHALGTGLSPKRLVRMETSVRYQKFAEACDRIAKLATTERHRMTLKEMAEAWRKLAHEADREEYSKEPR